MYNPEKGVGWGGKLKVYDMKGTIPFSGHFTADKDAPNNKHRLKCIREFVGFDVVPDGLKVLDIGKPNYISRQMGITDNTTGDLNRIVRAPSDNYDIITCLEVIQHVMNPLFLAQECHRLLKPGGIFYVATPKLWIIPWFHGRGNFTEYKKDRMQILLEYAGFEPLRYKEYNPWPLSFIFYGIRPPFRYLHNRFQMWELRKNG